MDHDREPIQLSDQDLQKVTNDIDNRHFLDKITDTLFSAQIDPRLQAARELAKRMGISEQDVLKKLGISSEQDLLKYGSFPPLAGIEANKAARRWLKEKLQRRKKIVFHTLFTLY